jgi:hypothetical protein
MNSIEWMSAWVLNGLLPLHEAGERIRLSQPKDALKKQAKANAERARHWDGYSTEDASAERKRISERERGIARRATPGYKEHERERRRKQRAVQRFWKEL